MPQPTPLHDCIYRDDEERCVSYWSGHNTHWIHANHVGRTPWGWRDGVVASADPKGWVHVEYVAAQATVSGWHHRDLSELLPPGTLVRVHERYHVLGGPFGWLNLVVRGGLGPVPDPGEPALWAEEMRVGIENLATGIALPIDHVYSEDLG